MSVTYEFENVKRFWPSLSVRIAELDGAEAFTTSRTATCCTPRAEMTATVPTS